MSLRPHHTYSDKRLQVIHMVACNLLFSAVIVPKGLPVDDDLISLGLAFSFLNRDRTKDKEKAEKERIIARWMYTEAAAHASHVRKTLTCL